MFFNSYRKNYTKYQDHLILTAHNGFNNLTVGLIRDCSVPTSRWKIVTISASEAIYNNSMIHRSTSVHLLLPFVLISKYFSIFSCVFYFCIGTDAGVLLPIEVAGYINCEVIFGMCSSIVTCPVLIAILIMLLNVF